MIPMGYEIKISAYVYGKLIILSLYIGGNTINGHRMDVYMLSMCQEELGSQLKIAKCCTGPMNSSKDWKSFAKT